MRIVLRVDADPELGTGHFFRCLSLARYAQAAGVGSLVIGDVSSPDLQRLMRANGVPFHHLSGSGEELSDAGGVRRHLVEGDCIVLDRPGLGLAWEAAVREAGHRLTVIDDRPTTPHVADVAVSTALFPESDDPFGGLVDSRTIVFVGPTYLPLRPEFDRVRSVSRIRDGVREVGAFFGGSDPGDQIAVVLDVARRARWSPVVFRVVAGPLNPRAEEWVRLARGISNVEVLHSVDDMAALWDGVDVGIGSYGMSAWERCACGVPSISTVQVPDQVDDARGLAGLGAAIDLGWSSDFSPDLLEAALMTVAASPWQLDSMAAAARRVMASRDDHNRRLLAAITGAN